MKSIDSIINDNYSLNNNELDKYYDKVLEDNKTFKKIVKDLKLSKEYLMKYTSSLEESANELDNCKNCKSIFVI